MTDPLTQPTHERSLWHVDSGGHEDGTELHNQDPSPALAGVLPAHVGHQSSTLFDGSCALLIKGLLHCQDRATRTPPKLLKRIPSIHAPQRPCKARLPNCRLDTLRYHPKDKLL